MDSPNRRSEDRRNGPRRDGVGRRIHGERRTTDLPPPPAGLESDSMTRHGQRREARRRIIPDRRINQEAPSSSER
jgi:hypothetical protein